MNGLIPERCLIGKHDCPLYCYLVYNRSHIKDYISNYRVVLCCMNCSGPSRSSSLRIGAYSQRHHEYSIYITTPKYFPGDLLSTVNILELLW